MTITKKTFCPRIGKLREEQVTVEILQNGNGRDRKYKTKDCLFRGQCPKRNGCKWAHWDGSSWL